jgi:dethiobiotin synthetase/adenosylmethionine--8-amino-7-oxononanoate aminotransferase
MCMRYSILVWLTDTLGLILPACSAVMVVEARAGEDWMVFHDTPGMPSTSKATTSSSSSSSSPSGHSASSSQPAQQQKEWRQPVLQPYYDACSSWWTQTVTAALQPEVVKAVAAAAGRYGHILWPEVAHAPGLQLTQQILSSPLAAGWGGKVRAQ